MARGSSNNVTENRTRSKRGTPTREIEEKQTVTTRRKNIATSAPKVEKKANKKSDKLESGNSCKTDFASNQNEELNLANESVVKKEVPKKTQQNKTSKAVGRKRKLENTVDELTEDTIGSVEKEIVEKRPIKRQNKKLIADTMDESSQDSIKSAKSDSTRTESTKQKEDVIEEHNNKDKDLEENIIAEKISNIQEEDLSTTLDDSFQDLIKSGTTRRTRSKRKVEETISVEQVETKDVKSKDDEIQNEFEAKADIMSDTSRDTVKPVKGTSARKTRSTKNIVDNVFVEQKETIAVEAFKNINPDEISVTVEVIDENSRDSVKMRKSVSTRKTRSTKMVEESVVECMDKDTEEEDVEKIKIDDQAVKDKTDMVDDNDNVSMTPSTRKTRNTKQIEESITVVLDDIKAKEIKGKVICTEKDGAGEDSIKKIPKGRSTRKTRSAKKAEANIDVELKDEELKTNIKVDVHDDSSVDSINSNLSGPTRRTRNARKAAENNTSVMSIEGENDHVKVIASDDDSSVDSMNSNLSGSLRKTRNSKKVEETTIEKQKDSIEKKDINKKEMCSTDNNSKDSLDADKDIASKDDKAKIFIEKKLSMDTDKVLEQITSKEVEERIEKGEKEIESHCANDNSQDFIDETKNMSGIQENIVVEYEKDEDLEQKEVTNMKITDSDDKEIHSEKLEGDGKNVDHINNQNSELEAKMDQHENNADTKIATAKSEVSAKEIEPRNCEEDSCLKNQYSKETVIDCQESEVLKTCVDDNLEDKINFEKENEVKVIENKYIAVRNSKEANIIVGEVKGRMEEFDDKYSEIEKDVSLCGMDESTSLKNVEGKVLNPKIFDEIKHSDSQKVLEDNQSSNNVLISDIKDMQTDACSGSKEQTTFEDLSIQGEKIEESDHVKAAEVVADDKTADKSPEELELKCTKISNKNSITGVSENIDHENSTTSMIGEISEKVSVDIDMCSDKTEEASVVNFDLESSTTDSDTGNLVIADTVENTNTETDTVENINTETDTVENINTETDTSELVSGTKHAESGCSNINYRNQEDISSGITDSEKTELNFSNCEEQSSTNILDTSINNINGKQLDLEVETVDGAGVTLSKFEIPVTTQLATKDVTENVPNKNTINQSSSQTFAEIGKLESSQSQISSVANIETVDNEPKMELNVMSTVNKISKDNIQIPLTTADAAGTSKDKSIAENSSSSDKIVVDSSHGENNSDEKQKTSKKKKSNKSAKKSSSDLKEVERNEAGKKIITTYEVSSNVESKKGGKRNLENERDGSSGTEVSLALKIKRKRVEGVESYDVGPSSPGKHANPDVVNETNIKEQTQKLFADYQSEPGPSGMQQESRRSTRKRKREESDRENSAAPIRMYLEKFVPFLLEGLLKITYVRPEDPIQYLAEWMKENKEAAYSSMNIKDIGDISSDE